MGCLVSWITLCLTGHIDQSLLSTDTSHNCMLPGIFLVPFLILKYNPCLRKKRKYLFPFPRGPDKHENQKVTTGSFSEGVSPVWAGIEYRVCDAIRVLTKASSKIIYLEKNVVQTGSIKQDLYVTYRACHKQGKYCIQDVKSLENQWWVPVFGLRIWRLEMAHDLQDGSGACISLYDRLQKKREGRSVN